MLLRESAFWENLFNEGRALFKAANTILSCAGSETETSGCVCPFVSHRSFISCFQKIRD
jgi:hypothetical protein